MLDRLVGLCIVWFVYYNFAVYSARLDAFLLCIQCVLGDAFIGCPCAGLAISSGGQFKLGLFRLVEIGSSGRN